MGHFEFPALPGPEEEGGDGEGEDPLPVLLTGIDEQESGLAALGVTMPEPALPAHDDEEERTIWCAMAQEGTFDPVDQPSRDSAHSQGEGRPALAHRQPVLGSRRLVAIFAPSASPGLRCG